MFEIIADFWEDFFSILPQFLLLCVVLNLVGKAIKGRD